jgi:hypothetical protein
MTFDVNDQTNMYIWDLDRHIKQHIQGLFNGKLDMNLGGLTHLPVAISATGGHRGPIQGVPPHLQHHKVPVYHPGNNNQARDILQASASNIDNAVEYGPEITAPVPQQPPQQPQHQPPQQQPPVQVIPQFQGK